MSFLLLFCDGVEINVSRTYFFYLSLFHIMGKGKGVKEKGKCEMGKVLLVKHEQYENVIQVPHYFRPLFHIYCELKSSNCKTSQN